MGLKTVSSTMDPVNWWWTPFNKLNGKIQTGHLFEEVALSRAFAEHAPPYAKNTKQGENSQKTMSIFRVFSSLGGPVIPNLGGPGRVVLLVRVWRGLRSGWGRGIVSKIPKHHPSPVIPPQVA